MRGGVDGISVGVSMGVGVGSDSIVWFRGGVRGGVLAIGGVVSRLPIPRGKILDCTIEASTYPNKRTRVQRIFASW